MTLADTFFPALISFLNLFCSPTSAMEIWGSGDFTEMAAGIPTINALSIPATLRTCGTRNLVDFAGSPSFVENSSKGKARFLGSSYVKLGDRIYITNKIKKVNTLCVVCCQKTHTTYRTHTHTCEFLFWGVLGGCVVVRELQRRVERNIVFYITHSPR